MDSAVRTYLVVFVALLILLATTIGFAYVDVGILNLPIALAIAVTKALLIMLYFMHLNSSSRLVRVFAVGGFLWLLILMLLTMGDYLNRALI